MLELITFILVAYGLTQILVYGKIFDFIRPKKGKLGELFSCTMCTGFWVGAFLYVISPYVDLFTFENIRLLQQFEMRHIFDAFAFGCLASGTSYILDKLVGDKGININENNKERNSEDH